MLEQFVFFYYGSVDDAMHHTKHAYDHDHYQADRESKRIILYEGLEIDIQASEGRCRNQHEEEEHEERRFHNLFCFSWISVLL
jgi:hypothetical protein